MVEEVEERGRGRGDSAVRPVRVVIVVDCERWVFLLGNTGRQNKKSFKNIDMGLNNYTQEQLKVTLKSQLRKRF